MASMMDLRRNIALNEPHVETASGAVANFKTDMKSNLVGAKIYFQHIQDGTGTPSPDNVRALSGWDKITINQTGKNMIHIVGYSAQTVNKPTTTRPSTN